MKKLVLGIDPGVNGAFTIINGLSSIVISRDLPLLDKDTKHLDGEKLKEILENFDIGLAIIEDVHSAPNQGVASVFKFGYSFGLITGITMGLGIEVKKVRPSVWKNVLGLSQDKKHSRELAEKIFPNTCHFKMAKDHNKAESALLAYFGIRSFAV